MRTFLLMLIFLTRIPIKSPYKYQEKDLRRGIVFMPLIGLIIGVLLWGLSFLSGSFDTIIISLLVWAVYIWITGALHLDGLADTVDGVFSSSDQGKMLEIMKDSRIGTFGVISIFLLLSFNIILTKELNFIYLLIVPVIGRSCALLACATGNPARTAGMGKNFIKNSGPREGIIAIFFPLLIALTINFKLIIAIVIVEVLTLYMISYFKRKLSGLTGDNLGFIIEISQTFFLFSIYLLRGIL